MISGSVPATKAVNILGTYSSLPGICSCAMAILGCVRFHSVATASSKRAIAGSAPPQSATCRVMVSPARSPLLVRRQPETLDKAIARKRTALRRRAGVMHLDRKDGNGKPGDILGSLLFLSDILHRGRINGQPSAQVEVNLR